MFCEEFPWFEKRSDRREIDEYDERSILLLLRHAQTDEDIGCVRVVKTTPGDPRCRLPIENICADLLDRSIIDPEKLARHTLGEVSRLGVVKKYRRRKGESDLSVPVQDSDDSPDHSTPNRRQFPYLLATLYLATYAVAHREGMNHLFTVTEPRLVSHLVKLGVPITLIGSPVEYKGLRVPAVIDVDAGIRALNPFVRDLYGEIVHQIDAHYSSHAISGL
jgi:N-acyl amino acid synthase of PEP-CTERM/exosortase system